MSDYALNKSVNVLEEPQLGGYDELFEPPAPDVYECPICLLVLRQSVQTTCGHRFCYQCISKVIKEGRKNCPIDNESLDESQVFPDNFANREIRNLTVRCRNHTLYGCEWIGVLNNLSQHLEKCEYGEEQCPNSCGKKIKRTDMQNHLEKTCEKRIVTCQYCKLKVLFKILQEHYERCSKYLVACPNACENSSIPRDQLDAHIESNCSRAMVQCPYADFGCSFTGARDAVDAHTSKAEHTLVLLNAMKTLQNTVASQEIKISELMEQNESLLGGASARHAASWSHTTSSPMITKSVEERLEIIELNQEKTKNLVELYHNECKQHRDDVDTKVYNVSMELQEQKEFVGELDARSWKGEFVWKISNVDDLFRKAVKGELPAIHSQPFYTRVPGYKMCLRVNLNGIDSGQGTHVSMFIHLMRGEYDSMMKWPFPGNVTLTIIDQESNDPAPVREALNARPSLQAFLRPTSNRNHKGYGYVEMIPHAILRTRGYTLNDTMLVLAEVKMPLR